MRVKVRSEWIDAQDEPVAVELDYRDLERINRIRRDPGDWRPRVYAMLPEDWPEYKARHWMRG